MNCIQARTMLAAYKELSQDARETQELDEHLEQCAACRMTLAQYTMIGEGVRSLPSIPPRANAHAQLMEALAEEHIRALQNAPSTAHIPPVPTFLTPYLHEHARKNTSVALGAFSTAETGPLPVIKLPRKRKRYRSLHMNQFAIVGAAALFLMILMTGGLTSFLFMTNQTGSKPTPKDNGSQLVPAPQVSVNKFVTTAAYPYIASAVGNRQSIYYTAYDQDKTNWILAQLDNNTKVSVPLLPTTSSDSLIVLGSSDNWLVWLQLGDNQTVKNSTKSSNASKTKTIFSWRLKALYLGSDPDALYKNDQPITLYQGTFDESTAPGWITTPIQGTWFSLDSLLVTLIDAKGTSHLLNFHMDAETKFKAVEIATAKHQHVLTSPTATIDTSAIYWSEEWLSSDNILASNIWTQKTATREPVNYNDLFNTPQTTVEKYRVLDNEMSFSPQVVNETLFFLNVPPKQATTEVTPTPETTANVSNTLRIDPTIYNPRIDQYIQGTMRAFAVQNDKEVRAPVDNDELVSTLQGGSRFLLWQNKNRGLGMWDAGTNQPVTIGNVVPNAPTLLAVNGETVVWTVNPTRGNANPDNIDSGVTFQTFNWPVQP